MKDAGTRGGSFHSGKTKRGESFLLRKCISPRNPAWLGKSEGHVHWMWSGTSAELTFMFL